MDNKREFEIILRQNVPLLTKTTWFGIALFLVILVVLWLFMSPAIDSRSSTEMGTAYFILAVPDWLKYLSIVAVIGLLILVPLSLIRRKIPSRLNFELDAIGIRNKYRDQRIRNDQIKKVFLNELKYFSGLPKCKIQVVIYYYYGDRFGNTKNINFLLSDYEDGGGIIENVKNITTAEFTYFDSNYASDLDP